VDSWCGFLLLGLWLGFYLDKQQTGSEPVIGFGIFSYRMLLLSFFHFRPHVYFLFCFGLPWPRNLAAFAPALAGLRRAKSGSVPAVHSLPLQIAVKKFQEILRSPWPESLKATVDYADFTDWAQESDKTRIVTNHTTPQSFDFV
jgi:hypothetical protein